MENLIDLSSQQKNILNTEIFYSKSSVNNICGYISIDEKVDFDCLQKAANLYVKHTDSMRLHFKNENSVVKQYVSDYKPFDINIYDVKCNNDVDSLAKKYLEKPFDIFNDDLFNFFMFKFPDGKGGIIGVFHHLICDAYSIGLLISRLMDTYSLLIKQGLSAGDSPHNIDIYDNQVSLFSSNNEENTDSLISKNIFSTNDKNLNQNENLHYNFDILKDNFPSYINYVNNSSKYLNSEKYNRDKDFWVKKFEKEPNLTYIYNKSAINDSDVSGDRVSCKIDLEIYKKISEFTKKIHVSNYAFFTSIFSIFLSKLNNTNSCIIGSPVLNRTNYEEKQIAGMFVSTIPLTIDVDFKSNFVDFAKNVQVSQMSLFRHQKFPYLELLQYVKERFDMNKNLYDFVFSFQNARDNKNSSDVKYHSDWVANTSIANSIEAHFYDMDGEAEPYIYYNFQTSKFTKDDILNINSIIMNMCTLALDNPALSDIPIVSDSDIKAYEAYNNTSFKYNKNESIVSIFEKVVNKNKNKKAVIFKDSFLTYQNLDNESNKIANFLLSNKVHRNDVVGILLYRSLDLYTSMWGILKTGASYLLIDPALPHDRVKYMLENASCKKVITIDNLPNSLRDLDVSFYDLKIIKNSSSKIKLVDTPNSDRFCVLYTSGSTGKPKGVELKRLSVINLVNSFKQILNTDKCNMFLSTSTVAFDMFMVESFLPILSGKTVVLTDENEQKIPIFTSKLIVDKKIDFIVSTPSKISLLLNEDPECLRNVKVFQLGGEVFTKTLYRKLRASTNGDIHNGYGPSECTACSTNKKITDENDINIGKPYLNVNVKIENSNGDLMPVGFIGEIVISGDGVSIGYINKYNFNGVYKTGDLGFLNSNGDIEYVGRKDTQIKMHGLRIELDEINKVLLSISGIKNAVSVIKKINGIDSICAFVEGDSSSFDETLIKAKLGNSLPYYMVPSHIVLLDKLPITLNGKIDTKNLPEIDLGDDIYVAPKTDTEKILANIWDRILNNETSHTKIGSTSNFFDLGGDSLCAIRLVSEIYSNFNVNIDIKDIFQYSTVSDLAKFIDEKIVDKAGSADNSSVLSDSANSNLNNATSKKIQRHAKRGYYPLSSAQKRIYFTCSQDENSLAYNTPFAIEFDKTPDINKLKFAFNKIINSNESFRTSFVLTNSDISQVVQDHIDYDLKVNNFKNDKFVRAFDLNEAPLIHAELDLYDNKSLLQIDIHHIICDGISIQTFAKELCDYYNNYDKYVSLDGSENNTSNSFDYIDFAINEKINDDDKKYWLSQFDGDIQMLNMPTVFERSFASNHAGKSIYSSLDNYDNINKFCRKNGVTPYMFLLACFYVLLYKYSMQNEIVIGTPVSGRTLKEFENTIGMFVNTLALKENIESSENFGTFLNDVKTHSVEAFSHQNYPFDDLIKSLKVKHSSGVNPLFNIMFSFESAGIPELNFEGLKASYVIPENNTSKFDISMEITPVTHDMKKNYQIRVEYLTSLYNEEFISDFIKCYKNIISKVIMSNLNVQIGKIKMCSDDMISKVEMYPKLDYPKDKNIIDLFNEQVKKTPNKIALYFGNQKFTYKELDEKSNVLANYIMNLDIYKNKILKDKYRVIGILMNRRPELIISILAILKAGAGYVPIDPTYPSERISYILNDSEAKLVLIEKNTENIAIQNNLKKVPSETTSNDISNEVLKRYVIVDDDSIKSKKAHVNCISKPDDVAYMIYTSGSTGKPKGVLLRQRSVVNFIYGMNDRMPLKNKTIVNITTMCFDIFVLESVLPLCSDMTIVLANNEEQNNPLLLNKLCIKYGVEVLQTTPSKFKFLMSDPENIDYIKNLKIISLAGEPFTTDLYKSIQKIAQNAQIFNMYGPTETTIGSTLKEIVSDKFPVNIGIPIANTFTTILDNDLNPVPKYVPGVLYIGGDGVSIGYKGRDDLNKERFIYYKNIRIYNSGDLAKVVPSTIFENNYKPLYTGDDIIDYGEIVCLGRSDFQVKVHGLRIELGEIENDIRAFKSVKEAVVTVKNISGRQMLCGYFTANSRVSTSLLKQSLQSKLPRYMVPVYLVQLEGFTYTPNGKIDRKVLPDPEIKNKKIILPKTSLEQEILLIWKSILSLDEISIDDNFFDIGGDSLCALRLQLELMKIGYNISYSDIFKYTTIKDLSSFIENNQSPNVLKENPIANSNDYDIKKICNKKELRKINHVLKLNNVKRKLHVQEKEVKNVLLTGATGFLGIHVLAELLKIDNIKVYCLIRSDPSTTPENKLKNKFKYYFGSDLSNLFGRRIFIVKGDISYPMFNLTYDEYDDLGHKVYSVINCAAIVKHYGDYSIFKRINVDGSKNVVDFCEDYSKRLYHISTLSVSGNTIVGLANSFRPNRKVYFSEKNLFVNQSLENVYVRSKFEAEKYILEEINAHKLSGVILRLGNITNRFSDGKFQENKEENAFYNRIKAYISLGIIPKSILEDGYVEFSPVDKVAESVITAMRFYEKKISVLHLYNSNHVRFKDLIKMLDNLGVHISPVDDELFKDALNKALRNNAKFNKVSVLLNDLDSNQKLVYKTNLVITNNFTLKYLLNTDFSWPIITEEYIKKILKNL